MLSDYSNPIANDMVHMVHVLIYWQSVLLACGSLSADSNLSTLPSPLVSTIYVFPSLFLLQVPTGPSPSSLCFP